MKATDRHRQLLRALLRRDLDSYEHQRTSLDQDGRLAWEGSGEIIGAAFYLAVQRRFGSDRSVGQVVQFVAHVRARFDESGSDIDPVAAESLIRVALGERGQAERVDSAVIVATEMILLPDLIGSEQLSDKEIDAFLAEAGELAGHDS